MSLAYKNCKMLPQTPKVTKNCGLYFYLIKNYIKTTNDIPFLAYKIS